MKIFYLIILLATIINCGSEQGTSVEDLPNNEAASEEETNASEDDEAVNDEAINTDKLIGTPFEGLSIGDDFDGCSLLYNEFRTESIDELPIKVFTAFFTKKEEQEIVAGIVIANEAVGYPLFEITDEWEDSHRVIYKINWSMDFAGRTSGIASLMNNKKYASNQYSDWFVMIVNINYHPQVHYKLIVAHELGHAAGISWHSLIDYENDVLLELEDDSLMRPDGGNYYDPTLTDYTYMMQKQGELIENYLGEKGVTSTVTSNCF